MNNKIEQNHRAIKSRDNIMKGFKIPFSANIFCTVYEEIKQLFSAVNIIHPARHVMLTSNFQNFNKLLNAAG